MFFYNFTLKLCSSGSRGFQGATPPPLPPACKNIHKRGGLCFMFLGPPLSEVSGSATALPVLLSVNAIVTSYSILFLTLSFQLI